jgi:hypothetical protein
MFDAGVEHVKNINFKNSNKIEILNLYPERFFKKNYCPTPGPHKPFCIQSANMLMMDE